ncbi:DUF4012 domain-containing protein [Patescibacteria group bacterium]|nr:DUF4012 domain-containing protein [Patescibacteria group bacterium]MBU1663063.1 DUF4012 domain-containing protein [Patescibacteria group bacterium]MBU1934007.1 DUF4012 domain-containing protein [Patescibacteria group bacterium]
MTSNKFQNLKINSAVLTSRFVIDLKQNLLEKEIQQPKMKIYSRKSIWPQSPEIKKPQNIEEKFEKLVKIDNYLSTPSNQLAFITLGKLLYIILKKVFILFYKICYAVGWAIVFILRLAYFLFLAIIRPIKKIFYKLQPMIDKIFKYISQGYQAKQTTAISMFVRLPCLFQKLAMTGKKLIAEERDCFIIDTPRNDKHPIGYLKPTLVFAGILLVIILPVKAFTYYKVIDLVKGRVLGASQSAMGNLVLAGQSAADFNFDQAGQGFESAGNNFLSAQNELEEINGLLFSLASVLPDKNIRLAAASKDILKAGESSANAGQNLSLAMASFFNDKENNVNSILKNLSFYGHNAIINLTELTNALDRINSEIIPENYQKQFILLKQKIGEINRGLKEFISLADSLNNFLGASADKRYLLVFQNNSELRASGGFIGSFALIDFSKGKIKNLEVPGGGSYDTEAGFLKKIKAPEPLSLVNSCWHFWDANWWPDWPTSARKLAWFYENSDGSTVDGVLSFTSTVMEKLLKITGPIDLKDKYGLVFDADNFWLETQKLAEQKPDVTKEPKKIIGDLMDKIIQELPKRLSKDNIALLFNLMEESLADKNILFYFTDKDQEAKVDDFGWSGSIKNTDGDYLNVINTNIAGGKSDRKIKQNIIHKTKIQLDGSIVDELIIRRVHEAINREPFSGVRNVNWIRVYVPLGSELIEVSGFKPVDKIFFEKDIAGMNDDPDVLAGEGQARTDELTGTKIYNEFGKTVFANWSQLDPGETIEINIKYKLPFKLTDQKQVLNQKFTDQLIAKAGAILNPEQKNLYSYSLLVQKQPGMNSSTIESELELNNCFESIWKYPASLNQNQNSWLINEDLNQDKIMAIIVEEK